MTEKIKIIPRAEINDYPRIRSDIQAFIDSIPQDTNQAVEREFKTNYEAVKFGAIVRYHLKGKNMDCIVRGKKVYAYLADPVVEIVKKEATS